MHLMLDLETLSTKKNAVVLSLGLVAFSREEELITVNCWHLDVEEQIRAGRAIDWSTLVWWMEQSDEARRRAFFPERDRESVRDVFAHLKVVVDGIQRQGTLQGVWCKGPSFDGALIESLAEQFDLESPFPYNIWRDVRTVCDGHPPLPPGSDLVAHDPTDDCIHQVRCVRKAWGCA